MKLLWHILREYTNIKLFCGRVFLRCGCANAVFGRRSVSYEELSRLRFFISSSLVKNCMILVFTWKIVLVSETIIFLWVCEAFKFKIKSSLWSVDVRGIEVNLLKACNWEAILLIETLSTVWLLNEEWTSCKKNKIC